MPLAVFGISGSTGQALAREAIERGFTVSGLVRLDSPSAGWKPQAAAVGELAPGRVPAGANSQLVPERVRAAASTQLAPEQVQPRAGSQLAPGRVEAQASSPRVSERLEARPAGALPSAGLEECRIVRGSLENATAIDETLAGSQAAFILFGPRAPYRDVFCARATAAIIAAMNRAAIRRLIVQTGAMIAPRPENVSAPMRLMAWTFQRQRPAVARDREEQERIVQESGLDWTLVKPPRLTEGPPRGRIIAGPDLKVGLGSSISRSDLARLLLDLLGPNAHLKERIYVTGRGPS